MQVIRSITVDAPLGEVWRVAGTEFADAHLWASSIDASRPRDVETMYDAAPVASRSCETSLGPVHETVLDYDEVNHILRYEAFAEGMPGFVRRLVNTWTLSTAPNNATVVEMNLDVVISTPFNMFMGPLMKLKLGGGLNQALVDLMHYAETSRPSHAKVKAIAKQKKNAAA